jgi:hypothetical protein
MEKIYSKIQPDLLLHILNRKRNICNNRLDISPNEQFLQVSCFSLANNKTFRPHYHVPLERNTTITQESWVVIQGKIKVFYYDIDQSLIGEYIMEQGDCTITFYGGHNYLSLEDNSLVYEFKTGPYMGQLNDKEFIN